MNLTDHDPREPDRDALSRLEEEALRRLAERLLADLKEARDRLNQDSRNSSRPPGSDSVYRQPRGAAERGVVQTAEGLPTHHEVFAGNTGETTTPVPTIEKVLARSPRSAPWRSPAGSSTTRSRCINASQPPA